MTDPTAELLDVVPKLGPEDRAVVLIVGRRLLRTPQRKAAESARVEERIDQASMPFSARRPRT